MGTQNNIVVYRYLRTDIDQPFYIGIGTLKRARDTKWGRSAFFKRIRDKHQIELEILEDELDWNTAAEKEKWWIKFYGRINIGSGILCNLTDGGEGRIGCKQSAESIQKMKDTKAKRGPHPMLGNTHTAEARAKISAGLTGRIVSEETRKKISESEKGKKKTRTPKLLQALANRIGNTYNVRTVINIVTGETFSSVRLAAASIGMRDATLGRKLRGERVNDTDFTFLTNKPQPI
jgi:group I intron endonuclease